MSLGVGVACVFSVGPRFTLATEKNCLAQSLARRLIARRGSMPWAPNDGTDMRDFLNASFTPQNQFAAERAAKDECEKDERVEIAAVTSVYVDSVLTLTIQIGTADGTFELVLLVDKLTIQILAVN